MRDMEMKTIGFYGACFLLLFSVSAGCTRDIKHIQRDRTAFTEMKPIVGAKVLSLSVRGPGTTKPDVAERLGKSLKDKLEGDLFPTVLIDVLETTWCKADLRLEVHAETYYSEHEIGIFQSSLDYA